jgi:hypothetical protein
MAKQTINIGAAPNDGTGTPLRTSFDYCNLNFTELYTATGPSGNNIVVPGSATISGDLTVDTSTLKVDSTNNRVGIGTATPTAALDILGAFGTSTAAAVIRNNSAANAANISQVQFFVANTFGGTEQVASIHGLNPNAASNNGGSLVFSTSLNGTATTPSERYRIGNDGTATWYVGGSTAMTLNSTGLGVGGSPATKIFASVTPPGAGQDGMRVSDGTRLIQMSISGSSYSYQGIGANQNVIYASGNPLSILSDAQNLRLGTSATSYVLLDTSGNVGIGVTPITSHILSAAGPLAITGTFSGTRTSYITNSSAASIYYTDGGGSGYFTDFGNLIIQPRTSAARSVVIATGSTTPVERAVVKSTGQVRFVPLAADPAGAESGDVYYNSVSNKLKCYNGTTWNDLF